MTVPISIDPKSSVPPFEQVRLCVVDAVRDGRMLAGSKLPTVRQLAAELGVAVNTVAKSYRALESDGVIVTRGRSGSFVAAPGEGSARLAHEASLEFARRMLHLDVEVDDAVALVRTAFDAVRPGA
ncbi:GntR family transcriptional regulator [Marisediminicola sp. LYQ134]|uniref:GntR family transcriptional regulator n=1 Tax=unclassified Marisediminicola TaxID=2618316 RepID=UPI003983CF64